MTEKKGVYIMKNALSISNGGNIAFSQILRKRDTVAVVRKLFPSGLEVAFAVHVPKVKTKEDTLPFLRDLMSIGLSQKAAALFSGVSQSYASKLLRR